MGVVALDAKTMGAEERCEEAHLESCLFSCMEYGEVPPS